MLFKPDKKDILIMASMTVIYLVIALINLGSINAPGRYWQPARAGENFVLDLGRKINVSRIGYHSGIGKGAFRMEYMADTGEYVFLNTINTNNYDDFYRWRFLDVSVRTDRLRVTVERPGGVLNEIGIFEAGSMYPIGNLKVIERNEKPRGQGSADNLFDEQQMVPPRSTFMNSTYFDEIYHARTAYEHLNRIEPYESTHPPLGKILISLGILVFGMNPFGWRIMGTLFGAAMIPVMYTFGKKLFAERIYAFIAAFLMMFDFMHFAQTRIATIDVYATFFVILMFYYMYDYYINKSYLLGFRQSLKPLLLSGLFFGLGAASKWIALYGAAGLALLFFLAKYNEYKDYLGAAAGKKTRKLPWVRDFIPLYINRTILYCLLFFIVIPGIIYLLSYIPFMLVPGPGHELRNVFGYQTHMYNYHKNLTAGHSFSSQWWQWPVMSKPIWFYSGSDMVPGRVSTIVSMGNPAVWWAGIPAVIASIAAALKKRDKSMIVIFTAIAAQYLPWVLVPRISFIYHFFSIIPFIILSIVYAIRNMLEKHPGAVYLVYAYLGVVAGLFVMFYPALSGMEVSGSYIQSLRWFRSWIF
jgi:dolichyl-phosphate-mannose-protein mannosyltransferase